MEHPSLCAGREIQRLQDTEGYSFIQQGWPTSNQILRSFQLGASMVLGLTSFVVTAGAVARDLRGNRQEIVSSRPIDMGLYLGSKFLAGFAMSLAVALVLLLEIVRRLEPIRLRNPESAAPSVREADQLKEAVGARLDERRNDGASRRYRRSTGRSKELRAPQPRTCGSEADCC